MLNGITTYLSRQRRAQRIVRELGSYSDRELDDIGVVRADIPAIARRAAKY